MKYGSLFSGIGGFDLALNMAGFEPAWMCEIDKNCQRMLQKHFEGVKIYEDIKEIDGTADPVDILVGGFPCQDLSVAGKREGLAGERSGLWYEFARLIELFKPKWVVIENVPGLLSSNKGRDFAVIIQRLVELGYGVCWRVLDSRYFGVAQRRRRVFIVASLGTGRCAQVLFEPESLPRDSQKSRKEGQGITPGSQTSTLRGFGHGWQGQHNDTNSVVVRKAFTNANGKGVLEDGTTHTLDETGGDAVLVVEQNNDATVTDMISLRATRAHPIVCGAVSSKWAKQSGGPAGDEAYNLVVAPETVAFTPQNFGDEGGGYKESDVMNTLDATQGSKQKQLVYSPFGHYDYEEADESATLQGRENRQRGSTHLVVEEPKTFQNTGHGYWQDKEVAQAIRCPDGAGSQEANLVIGYENHPNDSRVTETGEVSQQLTGRMGTGGNNVPLVQKVNMGVRRLTPVECERLQGFEDGWTEGQSDSTRYRQLGNAVTVNVVYWIAERIARYDMGV